jgi:hypothetical protein
MNSKTIVKLSNSIGIISIVLLVYWVFVFIAITVFGLKIFKENITQTFYLSVVGILALMFGSLMLNVMFNLTRIAEKHNQDNLQEAKTVGKRTGLVLLLSFPIVLALLFGGDYLTTRRKQQMLISSATSIVESNQEKVDKLLDYTFSESWIIASTNTLDQFASTDKHFPFVSVIVRDTIDRSNVFLGFRQYHGNMTDSTHPLKKDFIQSTTQEEREYLDKVFQGTLDDELFRASDGRYELFYPYHKNGKTMVLYFSDQQRYGKIGR